MIFITKITWLLYADLSYTVQIQLPQQPTNLFCDEISVATFTVLVTSNGEVTDNTVDLEFPPYIERELKIGKFDQSKNV